MATNAKLNVEYNRTSFKEGSEVRYKVITRVTSVEYTYENNVPITPSLLVPPFRKVDSFPDFVPNMANLIQNIFIMKKNSKDIEDLKDSSWVGTKIGTLADFRNTDPRDPTAELSEVSQRTWKYMVEKGYISNYRVENLEGDIRSSPVAPTNYDVYYNMSDKKLYVYDSTWVEISSTRWRGVLSSEPSNSENGDMYLKYDRTGVLDPSLKIKTAGSWIGYTFEGNAVRWRGIYCLDLKDVEASYESTEVGNYYVSNILVREFDSVKDADDHVEYLKSRFHKFTEEYNTIVQDFSTMNNTVSYPSGWDSETIG